MEKKWKKEGQERRHHRDAQDGWRRPTCDSGARPLVKTGRQLEGGEDRGEEYLH